LRSVHLFPPSSANELKPGEGVQLRISRTGGVKKCFQVPLNQKNLEEKGSQTGKAPTVVIAILRRGERARSGKGQDPGEKKWKKKGCSYGTAEKHRVHGDEVCWNVLPVKSQSGRGHGGEYNRLREGVCAGRANLAHVRGEQRETEP